ncbi:XRE family transcriptional regulator [Phenylobacterium sp.]|uniref:XRE family transcriptional regulator n=1 Tax=Phenylobacterium sp. TaxID=1871053 RepID=UPI002C9A03DE|nr:XRE family transcriptional regulator [Phenylobacterium sp.]HVI33759.1 XRE family transcriptional regulator [Phenylobacterium sp.]
MFPLAPAGGPAAGRRLSEVLKSLRRHRRLRACQVADAMAMPLRSYEHFEAGRGRLNIARIHAFAQATDTDAFAILAALALGSPAFAVACADNKLMLILMMAVQDFEAAAGAEIARLEPRTLIAQFSRALGELAEIAVRRDPLVEDWFARLPGGDPPPDEPSD